MMGIMYSFSIGPGEGSDFLSLCFLLILASSSGPPIMVLIFSLELALASVVVLASMGSPGYRAFSDLEKIYPSGHDG